MSQSDITLDGIRIAHKRIRQRIYPLRITGSSSLSQHCGEDILLAHEYLQITGAFKLRGALNAVLQLDESDKRVGVTAVSTGNHGKALAYAAKTANVPCVICMSSLVFGFKVFSQSCRKIKLKQYAHLVLKLE